MKYHITREQQFFFEQHHFIEFEGLLSSVEHEQLIKAVESFAPKVRDISRLSSEVHTITHLVRLARMASMLTHQRYLRFGFDQRMTAPFAIANLETNSCIRGLNAALLLSLDSYSSRGIYFLPSCELGALPVGTETNFLLITWADRNAQYLLQPQDAYTHELKRLGYVFGDTLKEKWHPTLIR